MKNYLLVLGVAVLLGTTADDAKAATFRLQGAFESSAVPGSTEIFQRLENGSIDGFYSVPDGSLPGTPGDALVLSTFNLNLRDSLGNVVINYSSDTNFGAIFFQFFGPTLPEDGFVFNNVETQFQFAFPSPFNGIGSSVGGGVFGTETGPIGDINISNLTSSIAATPEPSSVLSFLALGTLGGGLVLKRKLK